MTQVFIFHIDLTSTVAMVTENGRQCRLNRENYHFGLQFGGFTDSVFFKIRYQKDILIFYVFCYLSFI